MPYRARRREMKISLSPLSLILSVAVGLWLGFVAIALSAWLLWSYLPQVQQPLREALVPPVIAPLPPAYGTQQQAPEQNHMFEQYKEILRKQEVQQAEQQLQDNPRNLSNPKCQFWLQQNRTAPTEKSRANVLELCN
ncbi:hypothetical protein [Pseudomonas fontis]|uniref:Uncharacterized protein n=1 Tax=Pseudomonas fontis TaxID=2942633 RepID=A0ABT5NMN3_9PSED|nr:hypothetical protein [Pseudomonas fontis]MDD0975394.1 hypothetical protein [Pseudomonas fontis]MDD0989244.1 hypothetical protein [Pseudomonas fontis]